MSWQNGERTEEAPIALSVLVADMVVAEARTRSASPGICNERSNRFARFRESLKNDASVSLAPRTSPLSLEILRSNHQNSPHLDLIRMFGGCRSLIPGPARERESSATAMAMHIFSFSVSKT